MLTTITNQSDFIVGLSLSLVGLFVAILIGFWILRRRQSKKYNSQLKTGSRPSQDYLDFLKKNFSLFLLLFFVVMSITGLAMVVTSLS